MSVNSEISYRRYVIRTMEIGKAWQARAFRGSEKWDIQSGATRKQAIDAVKAQVDAFWDDERISRGRDGYPGATSVKAALAAIPVEAKQWKMLFAHHDASEGILTATQLAEAAGYPDYNTVNLRYGMLGQKLAEEMAWDPPEQKNGSAVWKGTYALATGADANNTLTDTASQISGEWRWKLRPELHEAVATYLSRRADLEK